MTVFVKVLAKRKPIQLNGGKTKQTVIVANRTGTMQVTLWEERVYALEPQKSYKLSEFFVRDYNMTKSLSLSRQGSNIECVADIGDVGKGVYVPDSNSEVATCLCEAEIIAVEQLVSFKGCLRCKGYNCYLQLCLGQNLLNKPIPTFAVIVSVQVNVKVICYCTLLYVSKWSKVL